MYLVDRRLGDVDTEFQQLAMNTWRTPQRVVAADCPDQIADVGRDRGPADTTARLATPIQTEPAPMPAHQRLGLEDNRGFAHGREQPIEPDEDQAICCAQPEPRWRRPLQDDKLLAEKCCFGLPSRMRSEQSDEQSAEQLQEVKHPEARITIAASAPARIRFSVATGVHLLGQRAERDPAFLQLVYRREQMR